jgi:hypothetical protein
MISRLVKGSGRSFPMTIRFLCPFFFPVACAVAVASAVETVDVYLVAGQSNAEGNPGTTHQILTGNLAYLAGPVPGCFFADRHSTTWQAIDPPNTVTRNNGSHWGFGPELRLAYDLNQYTGKTCYIIKYAKGGTGLKDNWLAGDNHLNLCVATVTACLATLNSTYNVQGRLAGMFWMQGEGDTTATASPSYKTNLGVLRDRIQSEFNPNAFIVLGRIADDYSVGVNWNRVRQLQVEFADETDRVAWVNTDGYQMANDKLHYTAEGVLDLGRDMAAAAIAGGWITAGTPDTTPPPAPAIPVLTQPGGVLVDWPNVAASDLASYRVYRAVGAAPAKTTANRVATGLTTSSWTDTAAPTGQVFYAVSAVDTAGNESGLSPAASVTRAPGPVNQAPTVTLTSPMDGATVYVGSVVSLAANAADADGTVAKVEFWTGNYKLGEDTTAPFAIAWTVGQAGTGYLHALAIDDDGAQTTSTIITVTKTIGTPPVTRSIVLLNLPGVVWECLTTGATTTLGATTTTFSNLNRAAAHRLQPAPSLPN